MSKHTPGPWSVHPFAAHVCPLADMNTPIASMLWPTEDRSEEETFANAALIASAPLLLDALLASLKLDEAEAVIAAWCDINCKEYPKTPTEMRDAMNARDKARAHFESVRAAALAATKD